MTKEAFNYPEYLVTDEGQVINKKTKKALTIRLYKRCPEVRLLSGKKQKHVQLARLVLMTFNPCELMEQMQVHHIDRNRLNNSLENLIWVFPSQHKALHKQINQQNKTNFGGFDENDKRSID